MTPEEIKSASTDIQSQLAAFRRGIAEVITWADAPKLETQDEHAPEHYRSLLQQIQGQLNVIDGLLHQMILNASQPSTTIQVHRELVRP